MDDQWEFGSDAPSVTAVAVAVDLARLLFHFVPTGGRGTEAVDTVVSF
jgi:hypothetical protein